MPDQPPPDQTVRYEASSRYALARALQELVVYARNSTDDFAVYPATLEAAEHAGLSVTGPDLEGVRRVLGQVDGLTLAEG